MKVAVEICVAFLEQLSLMSRTHAAARSFAVACVQLEPRQTITRTKEWSGWQELNLRGHAPKAWGCPLQQTGCRVAATPMPWGHVHAGSTPATRTILPR